jgi:HTH-type transcriptional regulator, sugar sensing transcriptional regulator
MQEQLIAIGFTEYEAKAYLALLRKSPVTAYETAKESGIPTSKIYEVLAKLIEREAVLKVEHSRKHKFVPLAPDELIARHRHQHEDILANLQAGLKQVQQDQNLSYIWNIADYETLMDKAKRLIKQTRNQLLFSLWPEEMRFLQTEIQKAIKRGVKVAIIHFGQHKATDIRVFSHGIEDMIYAEHGGRSFTIVADSSEVLFGKIAAGNKVEGACSQNMGFVTMAEDYIKHDIYIMKIVQRFDPLLIKRFGEKYHKLRDVFRNEEEK